jgi:ribosome biogenesis GTPase
MDDFEKRLNFEEKYHTKNNKEIKKLRKLKQKKDKSKFKKTNIKEKKDLLKNDLKKAKVISILKENIIVDLDNKNYFCTLKGVLKKDYNLDKNIIAVGDNVFIDILNEKDAVIEYVSERKSILCRFDPRDNKKQLLATNIDQVLITSSVVKPTLKISLIDRYLIASIKGNMKSVIIINKIDLLDEDEKEKEKFNLFLKDYKKLGYKILAISCKNKKNLNQLKKIMSKKTSVFSGQSGVGKTSIINNLYDMNLKTKDVAKKTYKGAHVTSKTELFKIEDGYFVDTPGIKSFGIWDLTIEDLKDYFFEFLKYSDNCKYKNCKHIDEIDCSVKKAVLDKKISSLRFESYHSLIKEILEKKGY